MNGTELATQSQGRNVDLAGVFELVSKLFSITGDPAFRRRDGDFTRDGPLRPELITSLLLYMVADGNRRGYQLLLEGFWDEARSYSLEVPTAKAISAPSFCDARRKISSNLLRQLLLVVSEEYESKFGHAARWHGRRVFAVDGVKFNLQRHHDLDEAFGRPNNGHCPQVLSSTLFDVCAKMPIDVRVGAYATSERDHLSVMLKHLKANDVIVLDRGYPSYELFRTLQQRGVDFLVRIPINWNVMRELQFRGSSDRSIKIDPPRRGPSEWRPLRLRAVKLTNKDGEASFYLTTLPRSKFSRKRIRELYHLRWEEEEFYKLLKSEYIGQGQFRSKSPSGVEQEIHALELFLAISRYLMAVAADADQITVDEVGQKGAILAVAAYVTRIFLQEDRREATKDLRSLLKRITRHRYRKRPGRSSVRRSFKPNRPWTPSGRRGA